MHGVYGVMVAQRVVVPLVPVQIRLDTPCLQNIYNKTSPDETERSYLLMTGINALKASISSIKH